MQGPHNFLTRLALFAAVTAALSSCSPYNLANHLSTKPTSSQLRDGDWQALNDDNPGQQLDITRSLKSGKFTVVEFTSDY